jgi:hypothetical protein
MNHVSRSGTLVALLEQVMAKLDRAHDQPLADSVEDPTLLVIDLRDGSARALAEDDLGVDLVEMLVAFLHDEVVIELPEDADHAAEARRVESIMNSAMEEVTGDVPVALEYALSRRWSKRARAVFDADGRLIPCEIDGP